MTRLYISKLCPSDSSTSSCCGCADQAWSSAARELSEVLPVSVVPVHHVLYVVCPAHGRVLSLPSHGCPHVHIWPLQCVKISAFLLHLSTSGHSPEIIWMNTIYPTLVSESCVALQVVYQCSYIVVAHHRPCVSWRRNWAEREKRFGDDVVRHYNKTER